jgi:hypothetical protein
LVSNGNVSSLANLSMPSSPPVVFSTDSSTLGHQQLHRISSTDNSGGSVFDLDDESLPFTLIVGLDSVSGAAPYQKN